MCGRTAVGYSNADVIRYSGRNITNWINRQAFQPTFNAGPGSNLPVMYHVGAAMVDHTPISDQVIQTLKSPKFSKIETQQFVKKETNSSDFFTEIKIEPPNHNHNIKTEDMMIKAEENTGSESLSENGDTLLHTMKWGLIPSFTKTEEEAKEHYSSMINARAESLKEKPSFRRLLANNRCVVIVDGYFEWHAVASAKHPYYVYNSAKEKKPLKLAALYDVWKNPQTGHDIYTFTIITSNPSKDIAWLHDRTPVVLSDADLDMWLDVKNHTPEEVLGLLRPNEGVLAWHKVSDFVNNVRHNSRECIQDIANRKPTMLDKWVVKKPIIKRERDEETEEKDVKKKKLDDKKE